MSCHVIFCLKLNFSNEDMNDFLYKYENSCSFYNYITSYSLIKYFEQIFQECNWILILRIVFVLYFQIEDMMYIVKRGLRWESKSIQL